MERKAPEWVEVRIPFTRDEFDHAREAADALGMDVSRFIRTVIGHEVLDRRLRSYRSSGFVRQAEHLTKAFQ